MKNNNLSIFKINQIHTYFRDLMKIDFYDKCTIEWFSRNILKKISTEELKEMEKTITLDINKNSRINSAFWTGLSVVMAVFIGTYAILISLSSEFEIDFGFGMIMIFFILIALFGIIAFAFNHEMFFGKKANRLHDLIRILIYLKENEKKI
ncbi:hypothetical protein [Lysinibacillus capsici]|uniref:hypothetical protein n=1 Tax=Lysinibacillus capsici TaxID=2115968 RepID=UPI0028A9E4A3|nr:hypothetical protein [Lysinibacillus capsici]